MKKTVFRSFLRNAGLSMELLAVSVQAGLASEKKAGKPNIIFVMADDFGIDALSCYGGDHFVTPEIDALSQKGIRLTHAYTSPVCGPSRAMLMTGRYPFRNGAIDIDRTMRAATPQDCPSLPRMLKNAGYATGMAGKWRQVQFSPGEWGFEESLMSPTANGYYMAKKWIINDHEVTLEKEIYFPAVMQNYALNYIERHKDHPFFFYYALTNPHTPIVPTPVSEKGTDDPEQLYADNIAYIDQLVGELADKLEEAGIRENTVLIFTGDNGTYGKFQGTVNGRELVGGKATMAEGGAHVPMVVSWPAEIRKGRVCEDLIDFSDILPTLAELAGAKPETGKGEIDGVSFAPQLQGKKGNPRDWIFVQWGHYWFVRNRNWKLDELGRLYDMHHAPFEENLVEDPEKPENKENTDNSEALNARNELQEVLDKLDPESGKSYDDWVGFGMNGVKYWGPDMPRPDR